ncbi:MAG: ATP-binding cassette domain-containing protein [Chitinophagales bacterium]|jgi:ABC-2 type transport system ATP-binding protein|nr:ATP-binding cassette domain-containing protein [Chitinophagales bacterium]
MSILVQQLKKVYDNQIAVNDISFEVKAGEIVGFLGPNGAGKSTTMKILTGYIPPTSGHAEICGLSIKEDIHEIKKILGYLPEHNPLYLDMYVWEYLDLVAKIYALPHRKQLINDTIDFVGLRQEQHKLIRQLSKGYRQRVGIAQAILPDPKVLILDEPTTGLDPNQLEDIRNLIVTIGKEKTVMLSTHIMQEVEAMCSKVVIIHQGNIVANESITKLKHLTEGQNQISVSFDPQISEEKLKKITEISTVSSSEQGYVLSYSGSKESMKKILFDFALENGSIISSIQDLQHNLEDIFKTLTQKQ